MGIYQDQHGKINLGPFFSLLQLFKVLLRRGLFHLVEEVASLLFAEKSLTTGRVNYYFQTDKLGNGLFFRLGMG